MSSLLLDFRRERDKMAELLSPEAWGKVWTYRGTFLTGFGNTLETAIFGLLLALVLGIVFGLLATSGKKPLTALARVYVEFFQNTPIVLQMCFLYYVLAFSGIKVSIILTGIISQVISTIKDSSYLANVAVIELMSRVRQILATSNMYNGAGTQLVSDVFVLFGLAFIIYFVINFALSCAVRSLQNPRPRTASRRVQAAQ